MPLAAGSPKWLADPATVELAPIFLSLVAAAIAGSPRNVA